MDTKLIKAALNSKTVKEFYEMCAKGAVAPIVMYVETVLKRDLGDGQLGDMSTAAVTEEHVEFDFVSALDGKVTRVKMPLSEYEAYEI